MLVLMPLPARIDKGIVSEQLDPLKDVDGVTVVNAGRLHLGLPCLAPSTPNGGVALLDHYGIQMRGRERGGDRAQQRRRSSTGRALAAPQCDGHGLPQRNPRPGEVHARKRTSWRWRSEARDS